MSTALPRLFFALWPEPDVRAALVALQGEVQGRRVHPADLHLTLAFLGQQEEALLPKLKEMMARLPKSDIMLTLDQAGYFARNRIVWAGTHVTPPALRELVARLRDDLVTHGFACKDEHGYKPHITLARDAPPPSDLIFTPIGWRAHQVVLVQSHMRADGPRYEVLASRWLDEEIRIADPREDAPLRQVRG